MRTLPLNIKNLKALIASDSFKNLSESSQNAYRTMLSRKEARHAKRMAERAAEKKNQDKTLSEIMKNIHVGDVFSSSWGYEQTNVNFLNGEISFMTQWKLLATKPFDKMLAL